MSLIDFESRGEQESPVISVGMNISEGHEQEGPLFHLFIDGTDHGVFDWELVSERSGAVDYIEAEDELKSRQIIHLAQLVIANCMHSIYPGLEKIDFPDEDFPLAA